MNSKSDSLTYVNMMVNALQQKSDVLDILFGLTEQQESILKETEVDVDQFTTITEKKGVEIDRLNALDDGFDSLYRKLESELMGDQGKYADEIEKMKGLIEKITETSVKIQVIEKRNYERFQEFMKEERTRLRNANVSSQTAKTYAQNMAGAHKPGNSYFVNETK